MFVMVTLFAVWLGWELKFIRERRAVLAQADGWGYPFVTVEQSRNSGGSELAWSKIK
jgi:hypothetical protein